MKRAAEVAIGLPADFLHQVDRARRERKVSHSEYFRQAASNLLGLSGEQEVERYVRGYSTHPETPSEVEAARATSRGVRRPLVSHVRRTAVTRLSYRDA
jgi:metal-responsive CopG/Arc/MetJ family transcriptional regulator